MDIVMLLGVTSSVLTIISFFVGLGFWLGKTF